MRTSVLATLLGLSLVACAGNISGGGDDDDDVPVTCGNGQLDEGEDCDGGEGCSATCTTEAIPRLEVTVDKPTVDTELATSNMVTVTLTGSDGFEGAVAVTGIVTDAGGTTLPTYVVAVNPPSITVPLNGTATAVVTFAVPSEVGTLGTNLKISTTSSATLGTHEQTSTLTVANQITFKVTSNNGQCVYPTNQAIPISTGTKVRFLNDGNIAMIIHSDGGAEGIAHQNTGTTIAQGEAYEQTATNAGNAFGWYCHSPGPDLQGGNPKIKVNAAP